MRFTLGFDNVNTWEYVFSTLESWSKDIEGSSVVREGTRLVCEFPEEVARDVPEWLSETIFKGRVWFECESLDLRVVVSDRDSPWLVFG